VFTGEEFSIAQDEADDTALLQRRATNMYARRHVGDEEHLDVNG
jgi:hypothetical protein